MGDKYKFYNISVKKHATVVTNKEIIMIYAAVLPQKIIIHI